MTLGGTARRLPPELGQFARLDNYNVLLVQLGTTRLLEGLNPSLPWPAGPLALADHMVYAYRAAAEKGTLLEGGHLLGFDTGLIDWKHDPVYMVFELKPEWKGPGPVLKRFMAPGEGDAGKDIVRLLLPPRPEAGREVWGGGALRGPDAPLPYCDSRHIVENRPDRFPRSFIRRFTPNDFPWRDRVEPGKELKEFRAMWKSMMQEDRRLAGEFAVALKAAVALSVRRPAGEDWAPVPFWNSVMEKTLLLMPLSLSPDGSGPADMALVTEKTPSGHYIGHSVFDLELARISAKGVGVRGDGWLWAERAGLPR
jgi:hypothetical protein